MAGTAGPLAAREPHRRGARPSRRRPPRDRRRPRHVRRSCGPLGAEPAVSDRETLIAEFLQRAGWRDAKRRRIAGDASFRKYDRLERASGTAVLMDAPPPHEDVRPWLRI